MLEELNSGIRQILDEEARERVIRCMSIRPLRQT
jgi:hypothetical protein